MLKMASQQCLLLQLFTVFLSLYVVLTPRTVTERRTYHYDGIVQEFLTDWSVNPEIFDSKQWIVPAIFRRSVTSGKIKTNKTEAPILSLSQRKKHFLLLMLMIAGDIHINPGPNWKHPCQVCGKPVKCNQRGICCDYCELWSHTKCIGMTNEVYLDYQNNEQLSWSCLSCLFPYSDSLLESFLESSNSDAEDYPDTDDLPDVDTPPDVDAPSDVDTPPDADTPLDVGTPPDVDDPNNGHIPDATPEVSFPVLRDIRRKHPKNVVIAHININSLRLKFVALQELLHDGLVDVLAIQETKLDASFPHSQFHVPGYRIFRKDRTSRGGGIMLYVRSDIPARIKDELTITSAEDITLEITINKKKWILKSIYRPPKTNVTNFMTELHNMTDKAFTASENLVIFGDLNIDITRDTSNGQLIDYCDTFDLTNLIKQPTCFMKNCTPSTIDLFLTNRKNSFYRTENFDVGLSDCHNLILTLLKENMPKFKRKQITYRCSKDFNEESFQNDLKSIPFQATLAFDDPDDIYWAQNKLLNEVIDEHLPFKTKYERKHKAPFMNGELRRAINHKNHLRRRFLKCRHDDRKWQSYRKQRNLVTKLKRQALNNYFIERCEGGTKSKDFWPTIRPFLSSNKSKDQHTNVILQEGSSMINDPKQVSEIFNDAFVNAATLIGLEANCPQGQDHPSVIEITKNVKRPVNKFKFEEVDEKTVMKYIKSIDVKKATGIDNLSPKLLHLVSNEIVKPVTQNINAMIRTGKFPEQLKIARVSPIFKKGDPLDKKNYRPVSILPALSKVFERTICTQLDNYFSNIFHPYLSAFRRGYSCQSTLISLTEEWRTALDNGKYAAAILMDLSKAFDCVPADLLLEKLKAYGMDDSATKLMKCYLTNRKQCVKIDENLSEFKSVIKGVPQGSILGPTIFNIYLNDIFYFTKDTKLFNYADDNTLSFAHDDINSLKSTLENECNVLINWFSSNKMQANPDKFQALAVGKNTANQNVCFKIGDVELKADTDDVKLLGVKFDSNLNFDLHVKNICLKASRQANALERISKHLSL